MNPLFKIVQKAKRLVTLSSKSFGVIYMFHRCAPINKENLHWNEHMKVSPEFLTEFLYNQSKTHEFISLDTLLELQHTGEKNKRPFAVITFDDGYRDNYEYALPIFDEMHIPFTVYITNSFPDKKAFLWWYILEHIIQKNSCLTLSNGDKFSCDTKDKKEEIFLQLRALALKLNQEKLEEEFNTLFCDYIFDYTFYNEELCLSWDMIKEMSNNAYCTIAAHTMNHKTLNQLTDTELEYEVLCGKKALEDKIEKKVNHFSYPFGTSNEVGVREIDFIKKCGFDTACLALGGEVNRKNINKLYELPRVFLGELSR